MNKKLITATAIILTACSLYAAEHHVSQGGIDSSKGSHLNPFKTISAAAQIAQPGDVITVHEGVYRERVNPPLGGTSNEKRIVYQAAPGEEVVIKGSEVIKGWEKVQNGTWKVTLPNSYFGNFNPYNDIIYGEWYKTPKDGYNRHTGAVYLNEQWLTEASNLNSVLQPTGTTLLWFAKVDKQDTAIWAQFKDVDPNKELVEINVRQSIFYPDKPGRNYITVRGFTMRQAATPWAGAMSEQVGLIGTHWSKGWIIENNVISHSMNTGITLGRYDLKDDPMPAASAPGYVKSIELALKHGWSKNNIGSHIIRNNHISHCEKNGIHGSLGGIFSIIEGNTISYINVRGWVHGHDMAGLKLLAPIDTLIKNNRIHHTSRGIWLDWMTQGTRVTGNLLYDNGREDLYIEVNHGPYIVDNNIFLTHNNLKDHSQGGSYSHNLFSDSISTRGNHRKTPYHKAHSTEVVGLSNIKGGDNRFHNNILVGKGLHVYNRVAPSMLVHGNVYLKGAKPFQGEEGLVNEPEFKPGIKLEEEKDAVYLIISLPESIEKQKNHIVTTELLGKTQVSALRYEQPDGSPYIIDSDYFGKRRNKENPTAGPFENPEKGNLRLKVW